MSSPDLLPLGEIEFRYARCRRLLRTARPLMQGGCSLLPAWHLLFDGNAGWGLVWLPG